MVVDNAKINMIFLGTDFLENNMINGMYAFVVYDKMKDEYLVARYV